MNNSVFTIIFLFFLFSHNLFANCFQPLTLKNDDQKFRDCLISLGGLNNLRFNSNTDKITPNEIITLLTQQRPGPPHLKKISDEARVIFFNNQHCNLSSGDELACSRLGHLSLIHHDGRFENNYNCERYNPSQQNCKSIAQPLATSINTKDYCNHNSRNKHNCIALITGILDLDDCQADASTCQKVVEAELKKSGPENSECDVRDDSFRVFGEDPYPGCLDALPRSGKSTLRVASLDKETTDESGGGNGDNAAGNPTNGSELTNTQAEKLGQVANKLGQNMFGSGMGTGMMNQLPSPTNVPKSDPRSNASTDGFDGPRGLSDARMANVPGGSVHLPLIDNLPIQTEGRPGPRPRPGSDQGGGGGAKNPPMMGGGGMGGQAAGPGGGGAGSSKGKGGGGYRGSAWQKIADALGGNNYMGTDGAPGGSNVQPAKSALPKALQKKIAQNKESEQARAKVNAMFRKNLPNGATGGQVYSPFQFPSVNSAFDTIYRDQNYYRDSN